MRSGAGCLYGAPGKRKSNDACKAKADVRFVFVKMKQLEMIRFTLTLLTLLEK